MEYILKITILIDLVLLLRLAAVVCVCVFVCYLFGRIGKKSFAIEIHLPFKLRMYVR